MNYFIDFEEYLKDYEMMREFYIYLFYDMYVMKLSIDRMSP